MAASQPRCSPQRAVGAAHSVRCKLYTGTIIARPSITPHRVNRGDRIHLVRPQTSVLALCLGEQSIAIMRQHERGRQFRLRHHSIFENLHNNMHESMGP